LLLLLLWVKLKVPGEEGRGGDQPPPDDHKEAAEVNATAWARVGWDVESRFTYIHLFIHLLIFSSMCSFIHPFIHSEGTPNLTPARASRFAL
jgi:hypothetical protein